MGFIEFLLNSFKAITRQQIVMMCVGVLLIF